LAHEEIHRQNRFAEGAMADEDVEASEAVDDPLLRACRGEELDALGGSRHITTIGTCTFTASFGIGSIRARKISAARS
jgi:hypothetical protein